MRFFGRNFYEEINDNDYDEEKSDYFNDDSQSKKDLNLEDDLDVNKRNEKKFRQLMNNSNANFYNDTYWDISNPVVRLILTVLAVIIIIGIIYYAIGFINSL